jgi:predicted nucleotidyltransferase
MRRDEVLRTLHEHYPKIIESYGITSLGLFGSVARDEATDASDVDVLVDFGAPPTFDQYMGLKIFLEDLLQCRVDLVTRRALKERIRPYVEKDVVRVT